MKSIVLLRSPPTAARPWPRPRHAGEEASQGTELHRIVHGGRFSARRPPPSQQGKAASQGLTEARKRQGLAEEAGLTGKQAGPPGRGRKNQEGLPGGASWRGLSDIPGVLIGPPAAVILLQQHAEQRQVAKFPAVKPAATASLPPVISTAATTQAPEGNRPALLCSSAFHVGVLLFFPFRFHQKEEKAVWSWAGRLALNAAVSVAYMR